MKHSMLIITVSGIVMMTILFISTQSLQCSKLVRKVNEMIKMLETIILLLLWVAGTEAEHPTRSAFEAAAIEATSVFNSLVACTHGDIRLSGGGSKFEGRVEVCLKGVWGEVCGDQWTRNNARVACRQLGFSGLDAVELDAVIHFGKGTGLIILYGVDCSTGTENTLDECNHPDDASATLKCNTAKIAGVDCSLKQCTDGEVKLFGGSNSYEGVVTVCKDEVWWTVSGSRADWGTEESGVICSQLHYSRFKSTPIADASSMFKTVPLTGVVKLDCTGIGEDHAGQCTITITTTSTSEYAGIRCQPKYCEDGDIQVEPNASGLPIGRVLICQNENWGTLCMDGWSDDDASVVCARLGHPRKGAIALGVPRHSTYPVLLTSSLKCKGTEKHILDCDSTPLETCTNNAVDPAVQCLRRPCEDGDVRLVNGVNDLEGRIEICWKSLWGPVCSKGLGEQEAKVVCRQLGYSRHDAVVLNSYDVSFGKEIWLSHIECLESHQKLLDCEHFELLSAKCEIVDVLRCKKRICEEGEVKLVNKTSTSISEGILEVCIDEEWFNICDEGWSPNEDDVVCRQLGYKGALPVYVSDSDKEAQALLRPPFSCSGSESELLECLSPPASDTICKTTLAVAVSCTNLH